MRSRLLTFDLKTVEQSDPPEQQESEAEGHGQGKTGVARVSFFDRILHSDELCSAYVMKLTLGVNEVGA